MIHFVWMVCILGFVAFGLWLILPAPWRPDRAVWRTGQGLPRAWMGRSGDFYIDGNSGDVYRRGAWAWERVEGV